MRSTIKVLVVDDSALVRQMLTRALSLDPRIEIVGSARTGLEAIEKAVQLAPDVITLDIEMPELNGIEALPHLIKSTNARVVMLSALSDAETTYQALDLGATDFLVKPAGGMASSLSELTEVLLKKIKTAYRVPPERRVVTPNRERGGAQAPRRASKGPADFLVAIAASTGGPPALETVFSGLSSDLPAGYVIVQHLPAGFTQSLAKRLGRVTDIEVVEAEEGQPIDQGVAYIAPHGMHTRIEATVPRRLTLEDAPALHGVRPAADPMMESAADAFDKRCVGVVLSGMGADGAFGARLIQKAGGITIVQDEESSVVWGMPGAVVRSGAASLVVPLAGIAQEIKRAVGG